MKLHCGDMVEGALREALKSDQEKTAVNEPEAAPGNTLLGDINQPSMKKGRLKIVKL